MNQYASLHQHWSDYAPNDKVPFTNIKGKLRPAIVLGKSETEVLIEYWIGDTFYLMKIGISDEIMYSQQGVKKAKYDQKYWMKNENFALLENAALNGASWHNEISLYDIYDSERMRRALIKPRKTKKVKEVKGLAEWALNLTQSELPGFEKIERATRLS